MFREVAVGVEKRFCDACGKEERRAVRVGNNLDLCEECMRQCRNPVTLFLRIIDLAKEVQALKARFVPAPPPKNKETVKA